MQQPLKQSQCYKCGHALSIPLAQCHTQCPSCSKTNLFLCHVIKKDPAALANKLAITCQTCSLQYAIIECPQCAGYCAVRDFRSGFVYECLCGARMLYVVCQKCQVVLGLPPGRDYGGVGLQCRGCGHGFKYKICRTCRSCVYHTAADQSQVYTCTNSKCPQSNNNTQGLNFANPYINQPEQVRQSIDQRISQFQQQVQNKQLDFKDLCKVCIDKEAVMINTGCFHLALCEGCAREIQGKKEGECPICRVRGKYQRVFKP